MLAFDVFGVLMRLFLYGNVSFYVDLALSTAVLCGTLVFLAHLVLDMTVSQKYLLFTADTPRSAGRISV